MNKVLSWKITSGVYAYVYPLNKGSYISKKIPESSPLWTSVIKEIKDWSINDYMREFRLMNDEVKRKYNITIPEDFDKYWGFNTDSVEGVNIVLLSGDDCEGSGDSNSSDNISTEDINNILEQIKDEAYERQSAITQYVLAEATKTISEAKSEIAETKEHLNSVRNELEGKLSAATEAVNATKALFDEGDITPEKINNALNTISEHGEWVNASSGFITSIRNGVDEASQQIGGIAEAADPVRGYFSTIASNINALSGTVGTVSQTVDASQGKIENMASWYDTNASATTQAINYLNASAGTIGDTLEYINGSGLTTYLNREMNAHAATIKDSLQTDFADSITSVNRMMDGFSGVIKDTIVKYNETDGKLVSLGDEMDSTRRRMDKYMNIVDDNSQQVSDFRESWTEASGMLTTVGSLIYVQDADGNATGKVVETHAEHPNADVIMKMGETVWRLKSNPNIIIDALYVIPNLSQVIGSFIGQTASAVTMGVANDEGTLAQIAITIAESKNGNNESYIDMIADKVRISGELIANSLLTSQANIGGIIIGSGQVKTSGNTVVINGSDGSLIAKKGTIGGFELNEKSFDAGLTHILSTSDENSYTFVCGYKQYKDNEVFLSRFYNRDLGENGGDYIYVNNTFDEYYYIDEDDNLIKGGRDINYEDNNHVSLIVNDENNKVYYLIYYIKDNRVTQNSNLTYSEYKDYGFEYNYDKANTYIKSDGSIYTKLLTADNGVFNGVINATGVFNGDIKSDNGYLKNITLESPYIENPTIKGNFSLEKITFMDEIDGKEETKYYEISYNRKETNKNGNNSGKNYTAEIDYDKNWNSTDNRIYIINKINVKSGDTVYVPKIKCDITRYASGSKENGTGYLDIIVKYGNTTADHLLECFLTGHTGNSKINKESEVKSYTMTEDCTFSIILSYKIHLSTYSWLGTDKSAFNLKIYTENTGNDRGRLSITPGEKIIKNLVIANDGLRYVTKDYIENENGFGIRIRTQGIEICSGGTWYELDNSALKPNVSQNNL